MAGFVITSAVGLRFSDDAGSKQTIYGTADHFPQELPANISHIGVAEK